MASNSMISGVSVADSAAISATGHCDQYSRSILDFVFYLVVDHVFL